MLDELKRRVYDANLKLVEEGLVVRTFGNASGIDRTAGRVVIKPSGVPYADLEPKHMVVVSLENGSVIGGNLRPSSDTPTHLILYRAFRDIGGVVHTHSSFATGWAQAGRSIPIYGTTHADHLAEDVPCTAVMSDEAVRRDYEVETGELILECFKGRDPLHTPMVLVAGHGPFTWGETPEKAVYNAAVLEELARMAFVTHALDPAAQRLPDSLIRKHFERKHGKDAYYGQR